MTTGETNATYRNALYGAFEAASGGAANMVDGRTHLAVGQTTPLALPDDVTVVAVGVLGAHEPDRMAEVMGMLANPARDLTFVFFNDGTSANNSDHSDPLTSGETWNKAISAAMTAQLGLTSQPIGIDLGRGVGGQYYLNETLPYTGFPASLSGGDYDTYTNVPGAYALYLDGSQTPPATSPANTAKVAAYGLFAPRAAMQNGKACVFAFGDISPFSAGVNQSISSLAQSIVAAASSDTCNKLLTPDLVPTLTLATPLQVGGSGTLTVKAENLGLSDSAAGGKILVTLPAQAQVDDTALPAGCTKVAPLQVDCTLGAVTAQGSKTFVLPFTVVGSGADSTFLAQVTGGSTETGELAPQLKNNGPVQRKVTIAAPAATITGPATAQPNAATTVNGTATGLADGAQVTVTVNGTAVQATVTGGKFSANFPNGFPAGAHAVTVTGPSGWALTQTNHFTVLVRRSSSTPGGVTAVPVLDGLGLGALAALLGAAGLRRQRKRQR
ncbi:MAG: hypothetical protein Q4A98_09530 [Comamonadaceae bacterium]|nr:hypothetical protein [Comamonadaceae bacterium]